MTRREIDGYTVSQLRFLRTCQLADELAGCGESQAERGDVLLRMVAEATGATPEQLDILDRPILARLIQATLALNGLGGVEDAEKKT